MNALVPIVPSVQRRLPAWRTRLAVTSLLALAAIVLASAPSAAAEPGDADVRTAFQKFVAAQNAHDVAAVKSMLWNSPDMLFFSRGLEVRGSEAAADRFKHYYAGTWHLEPDMSKFHAAVLSADVVQILVPIVFTRSLPGGTPQSSPFLISQTFVRDARGWHIASILPVANTQIK